MRTLSFNSTKLQFLSHFSKKRQPELTMFTKMFTKVYQIEEKQTQNILLSLSNLLSLIFIGLQ